MRAVAPRTSRGGLPALPVLALTLLVLPLTACGPDSGAGGGARGPAHRAAAVPGYEVPPVTDGVDEPLELDLLRTVHLGVPVGLTAAEISAAAAPEQDDYTVWVLSRAALAVLGRPAGDTPLPSILDDLLTTIRANSPDVLPDGAPPGYGDDDLVYSVLYAAAVTGQGAAARSVLERHLDDEGSVYKHGVVLQALHLLGDPKSMALIQGASERRDIGFFAGVLTRRPRDPSLVELANHWRDVPLAERSREGLFGHIQDGCTTPAILAAWLVGYLPPAADLTRRRRDVDLLRAALAVDPPESGVGKPFPPRNCFRGRSFGLRSLGLLTEGTPATWMRYASDLEAGQLRKLAATIGFAHDPHAFAASALRRLAVEPAQYPQWELLWGTLSAWSGAGYRDFWDVWQNAPDLQFRLSYKREEDAVLSTEGQRTALDWLEAGSRPQNDQVYDWLLATISSAARGREAFRLLRVLQGLPAPERAERYWVLYALGEPATLPLLRYWATLDGPPAQVERLKGTIDRLAGVPGAARMAPFPKVCCDATEECLRSQFYDQVHGAPEDVPADAEAARVWLDRAAAGGRAEITFLDDLGHAARVIDRGTGRSYRFEHLYGCWRRVDTP